MILGEFWVTSGISKKNEDHLAEVTRLTSSKVKEVEVECRHEVTEVKGKSSKGTQSILE